MLSNQSLSSSSQVTYILHQYTFKENHIQYIVHCNSLNARAAATYYLWIRNCSSRPQSVHTCNWFLGRKWDQAMLVPYVGQLHIGEIYPLRHWIRTITLFPVLLGMVDHNRIGDTLLGTIEHPLLIVSCRCWTAMCNFHMGVTRFQVLHVKVP